MFLEPGLLPYSDGFQVEARIRAFGRRHPPRLQPAGSARKARTSSSHLHQL
jgi:hypothetical protein